MYAVTLILNKTSTVIINYEEWKNWEAEAMYFPELKITWTINKR